MRRLSIGRLGGFAMNSLGQEKSGAESASKRSARILLVDDEIVVRVMLTEVLATEEGYDVTTANDGSQAIDLLHQERFDLIITDLMMPDVNGIGVLQEAKRIDPLYPVIIITGYPSINTLTRLVKLGATDYITKPFHVEVIKVTVAKVLEMSKVSKSARKSESSERIASGGDDQRALRPRTFYPVAEEGA